MSTYYLDYNLGNDANDGLGWWKVAYTFGTGTQPVAGETGTGGTSGATAKIISVTGTWESSGTLYLYAKSGTFVAENLTFTGGGGCTIAGDASISSWKTITSGATTARIAPLDVIRIAKSVDPASLGNATWTNNSATLALASAQTINIETCDGVTGDWIQSANVTETKETTLYKEGSGARKFAIQIAFTTGIVAYKNISTLNLSTTQKISFWIRSDITGGVAANTFRVDLCSDDAGVTPVNSFTIPIRLETARWYCLTYFPDGYDPLNPTNLGAAIESIALYALLDPGAATVYLDNILACTTAGLNLQSLLGKNTSDDPTWWTIKSINGTTVIFGESQQTGTGVCTYSGTTEPVATYSRETIKTAPAIASGTYVQSVQDSGTLGNLITFSGGWNPMTNTQDGQTFFDGLNGWGYGISIGVVGGNYILCKKIGTVRYNIGINFYGGIGCILDTVYALANGLDGIDITGYRNTFLSFVSCCNASDGFRLYPGFGNIYNSLISKGNKEYGLRITAGDTPNSSFYNTILGGNTLADARPAYAAGLYFENSSFLTTTEVVFTLATMIGNSGTFISSLKHDQTSGNHKRWVSYGWNGSEYFVIASDTVIFDTTPSTRVTPDHATLKAECPIAQVPVDNGQTVTISVKVRESVVGDGTDYNGARIRLLVKKNVAAGISDDTVLATATAASEGAFEIIQGTTAAVTDNGVLAFAVDCSGTTGWISIDTIVVT